jgi:hypothetical protein
MPMEKKAAYLEAAQKAPELVRTETDSLKFVRRCGYDIWSASTRLCAYWKERKAVFRERAFLPLVLTGKGALTEDDVATLHAGWPAILPWKGQKALFFDRRKWIPSANTENRLRCIFYLFKVLAEDDRAQAEPVPFLGLVAHTGRFHEMDYPSAVHFLKMTMEVMPVKYRLHLLNIPNPYKRRQTQELMARAAEMVMKICGGGHVHTELESGQLVKELQDIGFSRNAIPASVGGDWIHEDFFEWCQERYKLESEQYREVLPQLPAANADHEDLNAQDKQSKRRLADLINSRRKRERNRREQISIKDEASQLHHEQWGLQEEHKRLEGLLKQAKHILREEHYRLEGLVAQAKNDLSSIL